MKRFLRNIISFILFVIVFYCVGICIFGELVPSFFRPNLKSSRNSSSYTFTRLNEVKNVSDIDILFVGSSHAYRGFDTRIFGSNGMIAFNLGTSAQTPLQTKFLLERYLDEVAPKNVIFQVSPFIFSIDGVESTVDILSNDFVDNNSLALTLKMKDINVLNAVIYSTYEDIFHKKSNYKERLKIKSHSYISGGYVENNTLNFNSNQSIITDFSFKEGQLSAFDDMIKMVKNKGINYYLIYTPITKPLYTSISKSTDFEVLMNKYGNYYNYNEILSLDSTFFYDRHHLNKKGVKVFNEKVILDLKLSK